MSVDWWTVERIMVKSVTGNTLDSTDMALLKHAFKSDCNHYEQLHTKVKNEQIALRRRMYS